MINRRGKPLRYAVMCNSSSLSEWEANCLQYLDELEVAPQLVLRICDASRAVVPDYGARSFAQKVRSVGLRNVSFYLANKHGLLGSPCSLRPVDMSERFRSVDTIHCTTLRQGKWSEYFSESDITEIRDYDLDFILRFGFNIIRGEILKVPRFGVWSFHHDDEMKYRGGPPCFWEIYHRDPITGAVLQKLTDRLDGGIVLKKGYFKTIDYSYAKNVDQVYYESAKWPAQVCTAIDSSKVEIFASGESETNASILRSPNNCHCLIFLMRLLMNAIKVRSSNYLCYDKWSCGVTSQPIDRFLSQQKPESIFFFEHPQRERYVADPFGVEYDGRKILLCEEYDYKSKLGRLAAFELTKEERFQRLEMDWPSSGHRSYPFLLQHNNKIYCVPEALEAREIALYEAVEFPMHWQKRATLVSNVAGVDPTLFHHGDQWWLAFTDEVQLPNVNLFLYYADQLTGPFRPHPHNPVKTDIRSARPAGTPFSFERKLFRPTQDCSQTYGGAVVITEITSLTPDEFSERVVNKIKPIPWGPFRHGVHTLSSFGPLTLIDGKKRIFLWHQCIEKVVARFSRVFSSRLGAQPFRSG